VISFDDFGLMMPVVGTGSSSDLLVEHWTSSRQNVAFLSNDQKQPAKQVGKGLYGWPWVA